MNTDAYYYPDDVRELEPHEVARLLNRLRGLAEGAKEAAKNLDSDRSHGHANGLDHAAREAERIVLGDDREDEDPADRVGGTA